ncbi:hypothetical protein [Mycobacterium sp.]|uniref:hypothetical protein n=1 Tax=Mycobacterium sp. TaxID=1785 RepID=UPI003C785BF2
MGTPFGIIADGLAAAVNMTGCAVVLFEAVSRDPSGHEPTTQSYVPPGLEPTIAAWTQLYSQSPA